MGRMLGAAAAVLAWLGWLAISPALSFPTLDPGGMINRIFASREDPGYWLGQLLVGIGLIAVVGAYFFAADRIRFLRERAAAGLAYGFVLWLVVGTVVMPIIGLISPGEEVPPPPPGAPPPEPDFMQSTVMMHHLGVLAPIGALVAWLLLGAVLGATTAIDAPASPPPRRKGARTAASLLLLASALAATIVVFYGGLASARTEVAPGIQLKLLARASVDELPAAPRFVSVLKFPQPPGSTVGPHDHVAGFAYALRGATTIEFERGNAPRTARGEAIFVEGGAGHAHQSGRGRVPAVVVGVLLLALSAVLIATALFTFRWRRPALYALMAALIAAGALAILNPWVNEYFFIAMRPGDHRGGTMTVPDGTHHFESPVVADVPRGPYVQTLREITIGGRGGTGRFSNAGPNMLLVLEGLAGVRLGDAPLVELSAQEAMLIQPAAIVEVLNSGEGDLRLLSFTVTPEGAPLRP